VQKVALPRSKPKAAIESFLVVAAIIDEHVEAYWVDVVLDQDT
jgi:hypothetical protein